MTSRNAASGNDAASSVGLEQSLAAARRHFSGSSERAAATELRILDALPARRRGRHSLWVIPLAAAFAGSVAFADEIGSGFSKLRATLADSAEPPATSPASRAAPPARATESPMVPAPEASSSPPQDPNTTATPPAPANKATPAASAARGEPLAEALTRPTDDLALYRDAHQSHFVERDYAKSLGLWDRYLALSPRGTFVLEARYNRAIALHRLGQRDAAIAAMKPFADGAFGPYRAREARRVLDELGASPASPAPDIER